MNSLMKVGAVVFCLVLVGSMFSTCRSNRGRASTDVIAQEFAKGLDLKAVSALAKQSKDAADFEKKLNSPSTGLNNIDLDDNGKVDYIKVTEYGDTTERSFSLTTELSSAEVQEIATITIKKEGSRAVMQTHGHHSLYGRGHYHHSSFGLTDALILGYLFSNHRNYASPYGYGNYPNYYGGGWSRRSHKDYQSGISSAYRGSGFKSSSSPVTTPTNVSPNAQKQAARARIISNPQKSQRSFAQRSGRTVRSGGFGKSSGGSFGRSSFGGGK